VECRGFDARDQARRYLAWSDTGKPGPKDHCFDIGATTRNALERFRSSEEPMSGSTSPRSAGNGSLMRLAPVPIFYANDFAAAVEYAGESSRVTHGADEAVDACRVYASMLVSALHGASRDSILNPSPVSGHSERALSPKVAEVMDGSWRGKEASEVKGSGYVVQALEAAIWCFATTESYQEAVLCAANLGDDADTTAAICGQLAGAYYGAAGIPEEWLEKLFMRDEIEALAGDLYRMGTKA
jgi:ADP-ribosyl-[dinitrogen reductase] hydrolase